MLVGLQRADADPDRHLQLGVRLARHWTRYGGSEYEPAKGSGWLLDVSAGWRFKPWRFEPSISVALYGALSQYDTEYRTYGGHLSPVITMKEVGPRISVHLYGLFAGISVSRVYAREVDSGPKVATFYPYPYSYSHSSRGVLASLHVGYSSPRVAALGGIAFQVLVVVGRGSQDDNQDADKIEATRISFGIEY